MGPGYKNKISFIPTCFDLVLTNINLDLAGVLQINVSDPHPHFLFIGRINDNRHCCSATDFHFPKTLI